MDAKTIYLDQNIWIKLARNYNRKEDDKTAKEILTKIENLSNKSKIVIPISLVNLVETAKPEDEGRRERLARFMYKLSKSYSILPYLSVRDMEIQNAIKIFKNEKPIHDISNVAISKEGIAHTVGSSIVFSDDFKMFRNELLDKFNSEDTFVQFIKTNIERDIFQDYKKQDMELLPFLESERDKHNSVDKSTFLKLIVSDIISFLSPELSSNIKLLNYDYKGFVNELSSIPTGLPDATEKIYNFIFSIPTIDVYIHLQLERDWDKSRVIQANDLWDIGFLSMAIPYCDAVIAEKYFIAKAKNCNFGTKYCTYLSSDLNEFNKYLDSIS